MTDRSFHSAIVAVSLAFTAYFALVVGPPLLESGDVLGAFAAGFANPYSSGYSADAIACWVVLAAWVVFDARVHSVRGGWLCLILGVVPGVVVGLSAYLILRSRQISEVRRSDPG
ncbi:MAG: DUF2834 domain-containing protein [Myxococcota bacterium]